MHLKRILDFMNEPGLTRENVASHLQVIKIKNGLICVLITNKKVVSHTSSNDPDSFV